MTPPEPRVVPLSVLVMATLLIGLPWLDGGRSAAGQAVLLLVLASAAVAALLTGRPAWPPRPTPLFLAILCLVVASAVHTLLWDRTIQTGLLLSAYLVAGSLTVQGMRDDPRTERAVLDACLISGLLVVGFGIVGHIRGSESGFYATVLVGPFGYPNAMAGFLLLGGGAAVASVLGDRSRPERSAAVVGCALFPAGLYLTRSRGAILAACVGILIWALLERERWWARRWLWGGAAALFVAGGLHLMGHRLVGLLSFVWPDGPTAGGDTSVQWRVSILRWTWAMIRDHPWLGVGPGAFPMALTRYQTVPYTSGENPHNLYLEVAAEYGLAVAILAGVALLICVGRAAMAGRCLPLAHTGRTRRMILMASLAAFAVHNAVDLDWSFPAIAFTGTVLSGLIFPGSPHPSTDRPRRRSLPIWTFAVWLALTILAGAAATRYGSAVLVAQGRVELVAGHVAGAESNLVRARWLNPLSFSAHYWLAWTRLRAGDPEGALAAAERTLWSASHDPNAHALVGEMALAGGHWEAATVAYRYAVELAPAAHLPYHAGLVEAEASLGRSAESTHAYERAASLFTPERVLTTEARCLAPGDRYLLARMSRIAARLYDQGADPAGRQAATARATLLAQPDTRGICTITNRPGQTSPEAVIGSFWRGFAEGGWSRAETYLPHPTRRPDWGTWSQPVRLAWIHSLLGGERSATVRYEVEIGEADARTFRCARTVTRFTREGWLLSESPSLEPGPCKP
jgi:O-antigen ligase